jgi:hypothetical protein
VLSSICVSIRWTLAAAAAMADSASWICSRAAMNAASAVSLRVRSWSSCWMLATSSSTSACVRARSTRARFRSLSRWANTAFACCSLL